MDVKQYLDKAHYRAGKRKNHNGSGSRESFKRVKYNREHQRKMERIILYLSARQAAENAYNKNTCRNSECPLQK